MTTGALDHICAWLPCRATLSQGPLVWPNPYSYTAHATYDHQYPFLLCGCSRQDGCTFGSVFKPVHLAAMGCHSRVLKALVEAGANPSALDEYGDTPLYIAARRLSPECVQVRPPGAQATHSPPASWH
jgi:hypothetical protein